MKNINIIFFFLLINIITGEDEYYVKINNVDYLIEFKETETANQIQAKIPFTVKMTNLNGNEIYYRFGESFTTNQKSVDTMYLGDIYLYQSDCLVLFYKTFTTSYQYTEIGKLKNTTGLDSNIGSGNVEVQWLKKSSSEEEEDEKETIIITDVTKDTSKSTDNTDNTFENYSEFNFIKLNYFYLLVFIVIVLI